MKENSCKNPELNNRILVASLSGGKTINKQVNRVHSIVKTHSSVKKTQNWENQTRKTYKTP